MRSPAHPVTTVDLHAHIFPLAVPDLTADTGDPHWPRLVSADESIVGEVRLGEMVFRVVPQQLWDTAARIAEMDRDHIDVQVVSPMPIALTYWAEPAHAMRFARAFNDQIAAAVRESGGRLRGLGTVPLQDPSGAIREMGRVMDELGLHGIEIGTLIGRAELDDDDLRPFFRAAADQHVPLLVHPIDGSGATRCSSPSIDFAIGMHTDTSLAGHALVYGGVLEALPDLRICLSHGGGAFPWTHPRLRLIDDRDDAILDLLVKRLWADTLVFDPRHLPLLVDRYGADHLVLGSDFPFIPSDVHDPQASVHLAVDTGLISEAQGAAVLGVNALSFLAR